MDKTMYRKIQEQLYRHYRRTRQLERFEKALQASRERIAIFEDQIRNCYHTIENPLQSPSFNGMPGSGEPGNPIELALMKAYEKMEREFIRCYSRHTNLMIVVNQISDEIDFLYLIIESLGDEDKKFIYYRYCMNMTYRLIEQVMFMDHVTLHRYNARILEMIFVAMTETNIVELDSKNLAKRDIISVIL